MDLIILFLNEFLVNHGLPKNSNFLEFSVDKSLLLDTNNSLRFKDDTICTMSKEFTEFKTIHDKFAGTGGYMITIINCLVKT